MSFEHSIITQLDEKQQSLALKLCLLPCFTQHQIDSIRVINLGLSQPCFEVKYDDKYYFAKYLVASSIEPLASHLAASHGLSPKQVYLGHNWLISEFIAGEGLEQCLQTEDEKLVVLLALLARCHRIPYDITDHNYYLAPKVAQNSTNHSTQHSLPKLDIAAIIWQLWQNTTLSVSQTQVLEPLLNLLQQNLTNVMGKMPIIKAVFCHGDANFSNVIQGESKIKNAGNLYQLIDFECACIAPIEYDLAMLMAVNSIASSKIAMIKRGYQQALISLNQAKKPREIVDNLTTKLEVVASISPCLVTCYLDLSLLINGLWYLSQYQSRQQLKYKTLAIKQLTALAQRYPQARFVVDEMR